MDSLVSSPQLLVKRINRIVYSIGLFGIALTVHLWIQKQRAFDHGCWGVEDSRSAHSFWNGCGSQKFDELDSKFGLSLVAWGFLFYSLIAILSYSRVLVNRRFSVVAANIVFALTIVALPLSLYTVYYQIVVARGICPLCIISTFLVAGLFVLQAIEARKRFALDIDDVPREAALFNGIALINVCVILFLVLFVNGLGTQSPFKGRPVGEFVEMVGRALPLHIDEQHLAEHRPRRQQADNIDLAYWSEISIPPIGRTDGVPVHVFIDPNCPSCSSVFETVKKLAGEPDNQGSYFLIPRALWERSLLQCKAIIVAGKERRLVEMWEFQFEHSRRGGMDVGHLTQAFADIGLAFSDVENALNDEQEAMMQIRGAAIAAGINSTPAIFVAGQRFRSRPDDLVRLKAAIRDATLKSADVSAHVPPKDQ